MKTVKILAISFSLILVSGKMFAQTDPVKPETQLTDTAKQVDAIDAFFAKYQAYLDKQKKPVAKDIIDRSVKITQADVNQAALRAAINRKSIDPMVKQAFPSAYNNAVLRAPSLELDALTARYDLVVTQAAPVVRPVVPKTLSDRQAQLQKAMAAKAALDKQAAEADVK